MTTVCFTGRGTVRGQFYTRDQWSRDARAAGYNVVDDANAHFDILVASQTGTRKAQAARARGVRVMSYEDFAERMASQNSSGRRLVGGSVSPPGGAALPLTQSRTAHMQGRTVSGPGAPPEIGPEDQFEAIEWEVSVDDRSIRMRVRRCAPTYGPAFTIRVPYEYLENVREAASRTDRAAMTQLVRQFRTNPRTAYDIRVDQAIQANALQQVALDAPVRKPGQRLVDLGD